MIRHLILLAALPLLLTGAPAQTSLTHDIKLYNQLGTVSGHVEIANHPSLGRTPCRNCPFLLVQTKCKRCVVYVKTDSNGDYRCRISFGRWRAVMVEQREGSSAVIDMLSPGQARYINLNTTGEKRFDIETVIPPQ